MSDDPLQRIFAELESIGAQLRSMTEKINSNNTNYEQRITRIDVSLDGLRKEIALRVERADERSAFVDGEIKELALHQGRTDAAVTELQKFYQRATGALALAMAALGAAEAWLHRK